MHLMCWLLCIVHITLSINGKKKKPVPCTNCPCVTVGAKKVMCVGSYVRQASCRLFLVDCLL